MEEKHNTKLSYWLGIATQTIIIITFIIGMLYYPVKRNFADVHAKIKVMETDHEKYCARAQEQMKQFARLDVTNTRLETLATDLEKLSDRGLACCFN